MTETPDLLGVRTLPRWPDPGATGRGNPALVLAQGELRVVVVLPHVKQVVASLVDAAADLAELLAAGDVYHA